MPYATCSDGVRVFYQAEGSGPPVYLNHGQGGSHRNWYDRGYTDALRDEFRLIAIDARGHGESDKPHDVDAYRRHRRVLDYEAVLDDLGLQRAVFWGYSMGSRQGFALLQHCPERIVAAILGGSHPYDTSMMKELDQRTAIYREPPEARIADAERRRGRSLSAAERERIYANDPDAFIARLTAYAEEPPGTLAEGLPGVSVPALLYAGTADGNHDGAQRAAGEMQDAEFHSFPGLTHASMTERLDLLLPPVRAFLGRVLQRE